jgi:hypothetical protein
LLREVEAGVGPALVALCPRALAGVVVATADAECIKVGEAVLPTDPRGPAVRGRSRAGLAGVALLGSLAPLVEAALAVVAPEVLLLVGVGMAMLPLF